jgi:Ca-activated chloride channel homolog
MINKKIVSICLICLLFLGACNDEEEKAISVSKNPGNENNNQTEVKEEKSKEQINEKKENEHNLDVGIFSESDPVSKMDSIEQMKEQKSGLLIEDTSSQYEVNNSTSEPLNSKQIKAINQELEKVVNETKDSTEIYNRIVQLLGSPNYKEIIEKAEKFEPRFDEPFMPNISMKDSDDVQSNSGKAIILLDAKSSMLLSQDGQLTLEVIKNSINRFVKIIGQSNEISLIVYGHKNKNSESDHAGACHAAEEIYSMGAFDEVQFKQSLKSIEGNGESPLAQAMQKAVEISEDEDELVSMYVISNGAETCNGDPVKEVEKFMNKNVDRAVHIIGLEVDENAEDMLKELSILGKGTYYSAKNEEELKTIIGEKWLKNYMDLALTHTKAPGPWEILDEYNRFDEDLNKIREVIKSEKSRYDQAVQILRLEKLVDPSTVDQVSELIIEEYRNKLDVISEFRTNKLEEIDQEAKDIREQVEEWKEQMIQLENLASAT